MYNELVKMICEASPFQPMGKEEISGMSARRMKSRAEAIKNGIKIWGMTIANPITSADDGSNMYDWWRNSQKWYKESPIAKVEDQYNSIEFTFNEAMSLDDAIKTVNDFVADWSGGATTAEERTPQVGDMVYLIDSDPDYAWRGRPDSGKIASVEGGSVKIRFHHHGIVVMEAGKMTFDREKNSWEAHFNEEFKQALTQKKGIPKEDASVKFRLPEEEWIERYSSHIKDAHGDVVSADENETVVAYYPPTQEWNAPKGPMKRITIPTKDLRYDWVRKDWKQNGV